MVYRIRTVLLVGGVEGGVKVSFGQFWLILFVCKESLSQFGAYLWIVKRPFAVIMTKD